MNFHNHFLVYNKNYFYFSTSNTNVCRIKNILKLKTDLRRTLNTFNPLVNMIFRMT